MNSKLLALVCVLGVAYVVAECPNACSGHGSCGTNNKCTCYPNWQSSDCSARSCPSGASWVTGAQSECSGKGSCDRKNGECKCFDGFDGSACSRQSCPNSCSGHGVCTSGSDSRMRGCACDGGYTGEDCSSRLCPKGDDPLTKETYIGSGQLQSAEVQTISLTGTATIGGDFTLTYTDAYGGSWTTRPMGVYTSGDQSKALEDLIERLPNQVVPDVTVTKSAYSSTANTYAVTFVSGANSGDQNMLKCNVGGCNVDGCQPRYQGVTQVISTVSMTTHATNIVVNINTEAKVFSTITKTLNANLVATFATADESLTFSGSGIGDDLASLSAGDSVVVTGSSTNSGTLVVASVVSTVKVTFTTNRADEVLNSGSFTLAPTRPANTISVTGLTPGTPFNTVNVGDKITVGGTSLNNNEFTVVTKHGTGAVSVSGPLSVETVAAAATVTIAPTRTNAGAACSVAETTKGTTEAAECSNRGTCDGSSGVCSCFSGYTGENCDTQNAQI